MSHTNIPSKCLVIDASIARAAGGIDTQHPLGKHCRQFLMDVRSICHRMAFGQEPKVEWLKHQSNFATEWLASMVSLRKLQSIDDDSEQLRARISDVNSDTAVVAIMQKDAHLFAAAILADSRIASLDTTVRDHFARTFRNDPQLAGTVWVNPGDENEDVGTWLKAGAPVEKQRTVGECARS